MHFLRVFQVLITKKNKNVSVIMKLDGLASLILSNNLHLIPLTSSDDRVDRGFASGAVDSGFIPSWVKPMTLT